MIRMIPEAGVEGLDSLNDPQIPGELLALLHGKAAGAVIDEAVNPEVCAAIVREIVPRIVRAKDGERRRSDQRIFRSRPSWNAGMEGIGAPMTRPREDWIVVLDALVKNDRRALAKVTPVITNFLARYGAYAVRDSWDDICQEVLIRLIDSHRRGAIREPAAFISYTQTITRNVYLDWIAKEGKQADLPKRLGPPDGGPRDPEVLEDLRRALGSLIPSFREVVEAIYFKGHSYEDAAELLDLPLGTLRRRRTQGIRMLRAKMGVQMDREPGVFPGERRAPVALEAGAWALDGLEGAHSAWSAWNRSTTSACLVAFVVSEVAMLEKDGGVARTQLEIPTPSHGSDHGGYVRNFRLRVRRRRDGRAGVCRSWRFRPADHRRLEPDTSPSPRCSRCNS
jgi:RNA polymerase sigma factor (sigma-70 family)